MADQGRWFKLWVSALNDPDLSNLSNEDFGRWCKLGTFLKLHGCQGALTFHPPAISLQHLFHVQTYQDVLATLNLFPNCNIVTSETDTTVTWRNWLKYQGDYSGDRVKKYRRSVTNATVNKTLHSNVLRREEKRREEKREISTFQSGLKDQTTLTHIDWPPDLQDIYTLLTELQALNGFDDPLYWQRLVKMVEPYEGIYLLDKATEYFTDVQARPNLKATKQGLTKWIRRAIRWRIEDEQRAKQKQSYGRKDAYGDPL